MQPLLKISNGFYSPKLNPDELLNHDVKANAVGRQRPQTKAQMMQNLRSYLRSTQRYPDVVKRYFQEKHVAYAAACGTIADFSYGAGFDSSMQRVVAPGVNILSTLPGDNYVYRDGTSMAAPHVAGVAALMLGANPNLTADQVCQVLTNTGTSLSGLSSSIEPSVDLLSIA